MPLFYGRRVRATAGRSGIVVGLLTAGSRSSSLPGEERYLPGVKHDEEMRRQPAVFRQRLNHFLRKTRQGKRFGTLE